MLKMINTSIFLFLFLFLYLFFEAQVLVLLKFLPLYICKAWKKISGKIKVLLQWEKHEAFCLIFFYFMFGKIGWSLGKSARKFLKEAHVVINHGTCLFLGFSNVLLLIILFSLFFCSLSLSSATAQQLAQPSRRLGFKSPHLPNLLSRSLSLSLPFLYRFLVPIRKKNNIKQHTSVLSLSLSLHPSLFCQSTFYRINFPPLLLCL